MQQAPRIMVRGPGHNREGTVTDGAEMSRCPAVSRPGPANGEIAAGSKSQAKCNVCRFGLFSSKTQMYRKLWKSSLHEGC